MVSSCSPVPEVILRSILFAPVISFELSSGEARAFSMAFIALFSPSAHPIPIIATPESFITVSTSAKSTLIYPAIVMISAIPLTAVASTSSALAKAVETPWSPYISLSFSLLITRRESTWSFSSSIPSTA